MARAKSAGASLKGAHQLLAPTATLPAMLAVPRMQALLVAVAAGQSEKQRAQAKTKQAQAARARRFA